jgi:hypothetical protein
VTLSRKSGNRTDGTPCLFCLRNIQKFGIDKILCTTTGGGSKVIHADLLDLSKISEGVDLGARKQYVGDIIEYAS